MSQFLADYSAFQKQFVDADGCFLFDEQGKKYIDFLGGWCVSTVGWKHPEMIKALDEVKKNAFYIPPSYGWPEWEHFAKTLIDIAPGNLRRVFRATSGSEAVEFAIKIARATTGRKKIVSVERVYHGHTYGAATVGNCLSPGISPGVPNMVKIPMPDEFRNDFRLTGEALSDRIAEIFEAIAAKGDVAGFISEPIFTNAGVITPPSDFYKKISAICKRYGILFIMDEVASGFGRTGKLFACEHFSLEPDIMCLAKGLSGGYASIGATLVTEEVYEKNHDFPQYSTFGWLPNDLLMTKANVELVTQKKLWENSKTVGTYLKELLMPLEKFPHVGQVRGHGLLFAIEFVTDKKTKERDQSLAKKVLEAALELGVVVDNCPDGIIFFSPPLVLDQETAKQGAELLIKAVSQTVHEEI